MKSYVKLISNEIANEGRAAMASMTADQIAERIWLSIADRRLRPGTRLKETELAEIFAVSRARIRQALVQLERDGLISIKANRGSFVAEPDANEARDVFHIRRVVEKRVLDRLGSQLDAREIARLRAHVDKEREADARNDRRAIIQLSGGFHLMLAEMSGANFLAVLMRDLISRSSLITAVFQASDHFNCGPDEHAEIVDFLEKGDLSSADKAMTHHLDHVENRLNLSGGRSSISSLREALFMEGQ